MSVTFSSAMDLARMRHVHGDIAHANDDGRLAVKVEVQVGKERMAVIPGDELRSGETVAQVFAGDA